MAAPGQNLAVVVHRAGDLRLVRAGGSGENGRQTGEPRRRRGSPRKSVPGKRRVRPASRLTAGTERGEEPAGPRASVGVPPQVPAFERRFKPGRAGLAPGGCPR